MLKKIILVACASASLQVAAETVLSDQEAGPAKSEAYKTSFGVVGSFAQTSVHIGGERYRITRNTLLGETVAGLDEAIRTQELYLVQGDQVVFATMARGSDELRYIYRLTQ